MDAEVGSSVHAEVAFLVAAEVASLVVDEIGLLVVDEVGSLVLDEVGSLMVDEGVLRRIFGVCSQLIDAVCSLKEAVIGSGEDAEAFSFVRLEVASLLEA